MLGSPGIVVRCAALMEIQLAGSRNTGVGCDYLTSGTYVAHINLQMLQQEGSPLKLLFSHQARPVGGK